MSGLLESRLRVAQSRFRVASEFFRVGTEVKNSTCTRVVRTVQLGRSFNVCTDRGIKIEPQTLSHANFMTFAPLKLFGSN